MLIKNKGLARNKVEEKKRSNGGGNNGGFDMFGSGNVQQQQMKSGGLLDDIGDLFKTTLISVNANTNSNQGGTTANVFDIFDMTNMMNNQQ